MLSAAILLRHLEASLETGDTDALLTALERNGLPLTLPLRLKAIACPATGHALGLRRLAELAGAGGALRHPDRVGALLGRLLALQQPDGTWGATPGDPLATAGATAALTAFCDQAGTRTPTIPTDRLRHAADHAMAALASMQQADGGWSHPHDRSPADVAATTALVVYLLPYRHGLEPGWLVTARERVAELRPILDHGSQRLADMVATDRRPLPLFATAVTATAPGTHAGSSGNGRNWRIERAA